MIPKFRAWDGQDMVMRYVEQLRFAHDSNNHVVYITIDGEEWETGPALILMQSTGLKDKNGVEIFEGDVLLHTSSSVNYSDTYWHSYVQVYRIDSGAYRIKGKHIYDTELMSARNRLEVVGNIYQNQNLLDKEYFSTSDGIVEQANEN
ncbi:hypothetical protein GV845_14720 [Enterococcus gallinarum]|uniref:YopX family protein n=1 Tax=Enterococcus gallinarum TaxID=1353 RepID=UPI001376CF3A|nr:YopX family protein [Enterococcus gallinarum]NCE17430.1 hypothetical protein [Enterococcus gallinarum]